MYRQHWNFITRSATAVFLRVGSVMLSTSSPDDCKDRPLSKHSAGKHTSLSFNRTFHCWPQSPGHHCESFLPLSERQSLVFEVGKEVKNGNKHRGDHWFDSQLEFKDTHGEKIDQLLMTIISRQHNLMSRFLLITSSRSRSTSLSSRVSDWLKEKQVSLSQVKTILRRTSMER